jgi:hypothetical protein
MSRFLSPRVPSSLAPNRITAELVRRRAAGDTVVDLTITNPTAVGLDYPPGVLAGLAAASALEYRPDPFGLPSARRAIAGHIAVTRNRRVDLDRLALTASTSEAYSVIFKLLCAAGDEVLVPQPSYPLFEHLAVLDLVRPVPYALEFHGSWSIDFASLESAWSPRTRAVIVVSPNNPTGSFLRLADRERLLGLCAARDAALVADEVFTGYPIEPAADACRDVLGAGDLPALTFALDGLSKSCGLPQVKLGWLELGGPPALVAEARARLELVLDTYLSVNTPAQVALEEIFVEGARVADAIRARIAMNWGAAREVVAQCPACDLLPAEAGWSAVLRIPATAPEEQQVLDLLREEGVLVHPGYFYDFPREAYLVVSLLPRCDVFADALAGVVRRVGTA